MLRRLTEVISAFAGVDGFTMEIPDPAKTCPRLHKMVGKGVYLGLLNCKFLSAGRIGDGSLKAQSWYLCSENKTKESLEKYEKKGTLDKILERYVDWAPEITDFLRKTEIESLRHWPPYELRVGSK